jgi:signal transduction histidine kinase
MNQHSFSPSFLVYRPSLSIRYVLAVLGIMFGSLLAFWLVMRPPLNALGQMAAYLSGTALVSIALGFVAYRTGWLNRAPNLRWALLAGYALSSLLTFLNVWVTARLMFTSQHDLLLATILLIFASGIAMSLGLFFSSALTDKLHVINRAAQAISRGDLSVQIVPQGRDEMADLAHTFNSMVLQLRAAELKQRELEQLRRDLIAWVSHDLQTPLASMGAIVEALTDGVVADPQDEQRYHLIIKNHIHELSGLIDDLFQVTQIEAGGLILEREHSSMADLLSDTLESFKALAAQKGVNLTASIAPGVDIVYMDTRRVGRVLNNLVVNALHHTRAGDHVHLAAERVDGTVSVKVVDTGDGISPEDLPHIFDRFFRGDKSRNRKTGGSGLGLAIARGIVESHGGSIMVESDPGSGSTFTFTLPDQALGRRDQQ